MQYEVEELGKYKVVHIIGNIDAEVSSRILDEVVSELIKEGSHHFIFNLERTSYLDSSGISIFIHCLCDVQENNGSIYIIAEDNQVREILYIVGIDRMIKVYNSTEEFLKEHEVAVS